MRLPSGKMIAFSLLAGFFGSALWRPVRAAEPAENILAVFNLSVPPDLMPPRTVAALDNLLPTLMAERGWLVIPRDQMRERLSELQKESYKACYDESCQIELGRELAAQKALSPQLQAVGGSCQISLQLLDLKKAVVEKAARATSTCEETALLEGLKQAADQLSLGTGRPAANEPAILKISSRPEGARAYLGKNEVGQTPVSQVVPAGRQVVSLLKKGFVPAQKHLDLRPGEQVEIFLEMDTAFPLKTWGQVSFWSGLGLAVLGGGAAVMAKIYADNYADHGNPSAYHTSRVWAGTMYGLFASGTALMAGGVVMWLLGADKTIDDLPAVSLSLLAPESAALLVSGRF